MSSTGTIKFHAASGVAMSRGECDVFLSFRGPDTGPGFTDHLYVGLIDAGIRVYRDDEELRKGEKIGPELLKGIRESKIAIPIFSKDYAASKWCLMELAQIIEYKKCNGLKVIPIFYDVKPSDVCEQTGDYAKAFACHEERYQSHDENPIKSWKAALQEAGESKGWDICSDGSSMTEGQVIKEVTEIVLRELRKRYLVVTDHLVGVEHHVRNILTRLSANTHAVQIVGIYGMGGIGKTTFAKVIYNQLLTNFEVSSFLADIRETSCASRGMEFLYNRLISDVLEMESLNIRDIDEGISIIRTMFSTKKAIILLDDIDKISQLECLVGKREWFAPGSIIIITTRKKSILDSFEVDWSHELGFLETQQALQLFNKHAFRRDSSPEEFSVLSEKAVQMAGGLPLALEVFGSLLRHRSINVWHFTLKKLESVSHEDVRRKLSISFEALEVQQQQIFLDIACFFIGEDHRTVIHFWEESENPQEAIEVLKEMSLIKIQEGRTLWMHEQLRDLGRQIVREEHREPGKCSRLWNQEEATRLFIRNMGSDNVRGINLSFKGEPKYSISNEEFARLPNLRLIRVKELDYKPHDGFKLNTFSQQNPLIFSNLRWLSWHDFPTTYDVSKFSWEALVLLDLSFSKIKSDWSGWSYIEMAKNLKVLNLTGCYELVKTPNFLSFQSLEQLILSGCSNLVEIDESILMLKHLVMIDITGCPSLHKLPIVFRMTSLEEVIVNDKIWRWRSKSSAYY